jgi:hypothetical protein
MRGLIGKQGTVRKCLGFHVSRVDPDLGQHVLPRIIMVILFDCAFRANLSLLSIRRQRKKTCT